MSKSIPERLAQKQIPQLLGIVIALPLIILLLWGQPPAHAQSSKPAIASGELVLPDWSFFDGPPLELSGDWEVVWGQLLAPEEFDGAYDGEHFKLPGRWNNQDRPGIKNAYGVATFRVRLNLPEYNRNVAFSLIAPHAAYRVYIDGVLVISSGTVSPTKEGFEANYVSRTFAGQSGASEIVMQVSNFAHAYGGPGHPLTLWDAQRLERFLDAVSLAYGLVLGIMFAIGLFHLIFYLADRRDYANGPIHLWFSILCFIIVYRVQGVIPFFHTYFPDTNYWENLRFTYASLYAAPAVYLLFFRSVFPAQFPKKLTQTIIATSVIGLVFSLIATEYYYTLTRNFSILLNVVAIVYSIIFTVRAMVARQAGALVILIANSMFLLTAINDAIIYTDQGSGFDATPFGILALGLGYSYALLLRLQHAFKEARTTSQALETLNRDLEKQVRDRTLAFKSAAAKAENAAEERARFIAAASHDLRQPLHALAMFNAALKSKLKRKPESELVEKQENSIANLSALLQDTLDTARAEIQQKTPNWKEVEIEAVFSKLSGAFTIQANTRNIKLSFEGRGGTIVTDPALLQRILGNLIENALKAANSAVIIEAHHDYNSWVFCVSDDGAGIANEDVDRIFESYVTLQDTVAGQGGGYGLGLFVVKEFSKLLGGQITVNSQCDEGCQFTLNLPDQNAQLSAVPQSLALQSAAPSLQSISVLAIDDELDVLEATVAMLREWGCEAKSVSKPEDAMAALALGFRPDVMLVDFHLHDTDGLKVIEAINAKLPAPIPAIMITGATEPEILRKIEAAGIPVLEKPIAPWRLARMIEDTIKQTKQGLP